MTDHEHEILVLKMALASALATVEEMRSGRVPAETNNVIRDAARISAKVKSQIQSGVRIAAGTVMIDSASSARAVA